MSFLVFIFAVYLTLFLKSLFFIIPLDKIFVRLPIILGRIEYFLSPWRDTLFSYFLAFKSISEFFHGEHFLSGLFLVCFIFSQLNYVHRSRVRKAICRWVVQIDNLEPNYFFEVYFRSLGSFRSQFSHSPEKVDFLNIDYRTGGASRQSVLPLLFGVLDTMTLARFAILAMSRLGEEDGLNAFDSFARLWGGRFAALAKMKLTTVLPSAPQNIDGKLLLVFNHKSYFDFALNFFALGSLRNHGRHLRPRFIAAKDHFIDNPFFYSILGIGKSIEKAGMIFIDRRPGKGWFALREAARRLIQNDVEVAVYPQGTRATALFDEKGQRLDAGYYTTFSKKDPQDLRGHFKKGTAQLILDAALELRAQKKNPLKVLFVGIQGSAIVGAKGSFRVQTEAEVFFKVGKCWEVHLPNLPMESPQGKSPDHEAHYHYLDQLEVIHARLDDEMEKTLSWHRALIQRFLRDPRLAKRGGECFEKLEKYLIRADEIENLLPFVILDRLYTLPFPYWRTYLERVEQLILSDAPEVSWQGLLQEISLKLLEQARS